MPDKIIKEIKKRLLDLGWSYNDLAIATGYKLSTINAYMANVSARDRSKAVGDAICRTLFIEK